MNVKELTVVRVDEPTTLHLDLVKKFLRVRHNADDDLINVIIESSAEEFEDYCRLFLWRTTATSLVHTFCGSSFILDGYEVSDLVFKSHETASAVGVVIPTTDYVINDEPLGKQITFNTPFDGHLSYSGIFGFTELPKPVITALLIRCSTLYHSREETVNRLPTTVSSGLNPYKLFRLA